MGVEAWRLPETGKVLGRECKVNCVRSVHRDIDMVHCTCNRMYCAYNRLYSAHYRLYSAYYRVAVGPFEGQGCE